MNMYLHLQAVLREKRQIHGFEWQAPSVIMGDQIHLCEDTYVQVLAPCTITFLTHIYYSGSPSYDAIISCGVKTKNKYALMQ